MLSLRHIQEDARYGLAFKFIVGESQVILALAAEFKLKLDPVQL